MKKGDYLFVYGTLRRGEASDLSRNQMAVDYIGEDRINARLYNLGWYPGVKDVEKKFDNDHPVVYGDVFRIRDGGVVAHLDAYEGYPALYDRSEVRTEKGRTVWVYTFNADVPPERVIETGDWKQLELKQDLANGADVEE